MYYSLGSVFVVLSICGILYKWDSDSKEKDAVNRQRQTLGAIHENHDSLKAFISTEMPAFVEQGVAPLRLSVDSLSRQTGKINTAVEVLSGKMEVIERMGLRSTAVAKK